MPTMKTQLTRLGPLCLLLQDLQTVVSIGLLGQGTTKQAAQIVSVDQRYCEHSLSPELI